MDRPWPEVKNLLHPYEARVCEGGVWLGTGRIDEVSELPHSVLGIGKRRQSGWGMIDPESLAVEPVEADPETWGLVSGPHDPDFATDRIAPRRPLPITLPKSMARAIGGPGQGRAVNNLPFINCIPSRFRNGRNPDVDQGRVWPFQFRTE